VKPDLLISTLLKEHMNATSFILNQAKRILIVFCFFTFIKSAQAQSPFSIIPTNEITANIDCDSIKDFHFYIVNPNQTDISLQWRVKSNTLPKGNDMSGSGGCWDYMLCDWQLCVFQVPAVDFVVTRTPIKAQTTLNEMKLSPVPGKIKGSGKLVIEVFEKNFPSNSQTITWNVTGCPTGDECTYVCIPENNNNPDFSVYPNPAEDLINVEIKTGLVKNASIQLYNLMGEKLMELNDLKDNFQKMDLKQLAPGGYFIRYTSGEGSSVQKIFKTK
jgi:hypothetical protein